MAGDWIKWLKGLGFRSEVLTVARKLNVHRGVVTLACMEMWEWADTETIDGHIRGATAELIDAKVCLPGFSAALESVGWLRAKAEGITLPNFERHNGKPAKLRASKTKRQRDWRDNETDVDASVDTFVDTGMSTNTSTREEKRREENTEPPVAAQRPPRGVGTIAWSVESGFVGITPTMRTAWESAYPSIAIDTEIAKAHAWLLANPGRAGKRKWARFLTNWFGRAHDAPNAPQKLSFESDVERVRRVLAQEAAR